MRRLWRFLFSRYTISAATIIVSLALIFSLIYLISSYSILIYLAFVIIEIFVVISIINRETHPEYKIPWLVISLIIPIFGMVVYIIFYSRKLSKKEARLLGKINEEAERASHAMNERVESEHMDVLTKIHSPAAGKVRSILNDDPCADLYMGSTSRYYPLGEDMFADMLKDIRNAKRYIFLEFFIIHEGEMWDEIYSLLRLKASEGVDVRLLYDDIGCMKTLNAHFPDMLRAEGISCHRFAKVTPRVSAIHNNRDHRKILCVDGHVAYTGGINIADEYINRIERFGHWKDGGVRVEGNAALGFVKLFLSMWDLTVGVVSNYSDYFTSAELTDLGDGGFYIPFGSGPAPIYKRPVGKDVFINIINQAQHYVYITTPYLIIDYALTDALKCAALRGVDVRIITPSKADKKKVKVMTKSSYPGLMSAGVKIYEYQPGFIHEKVIVSDDHYATVSTINFDFRSLVHHFEDGLWMYNTPTVVEIRKEFLKTISVSEEIGEDEAKLTFVEWLVRNMIRLFAPLL